MAKRFLFYFLPVGLWMAVIFYFSTRQRVTLAESYSINFAIFKFFHLSEYGFLSLLVRRALRFGFKKPVKDLFFTTFLIILLFAFSDEIHQTFVPTREGTLRDVIIDGVGASLSWIFLIMVVPVLPKQLKNWGNRLELF